MDPKLIINAPRCFVDLRGLASESYEPYGIYHSEMACVVAVCRLLDIDMIIESGRALGQSTYILAKYLGTSGVEIHSNRSYSRRPCGIGGTQIVGIQRDPEFYIMEIRLSLIPSLLRGAKDRRIAILIDGPKGRKAIDLFSECITISKDVRVGFIHDLQRLRKGARFLHRTLVVKYFDNTFFTDDEDYVQAYSHLDAILFAPVSLASFPYRLSPYCRLGEFTGSYGPTIGAIFPTENDRRRALRRGRTATLAHRTVWRIRRLLTGDHIREVIWDLKKAMRRRPRNPSSSAASKVQATDKCDCDQSKKRVSER